MGRQHQGMDKPGVWQFPEGSGEQGKMEKNGCKIICGAPTTLAVKGLMMMMMTCHCGNTEMKQTQNKSQHTKLTLEKKILPPLLPDSNSQPFDHESGALTNKLTVLRVTIRSHEKVLKQRQC